ncbi:MAG: NETI motif-containing protein [Planococcus sp. (in: firmicutes)]|nr:NETI motif-containing protein [Planococcus sp. (in: firmicutes)]
MSKKTIWFEVQEHETMEDCLNRMKKDGYMAVGRKEEPLFEEINGEPVPVRQIIKFKGNKIEK